MASILEDKDAIRETIARYCLFFDGGEWDKWLELFADDVVFDERPKVALYEGKEHLRDLIADVPNIFEMSDGVPLIKHCGMNIVIELNGDEAIADMTMMAFRSKGAGYIVTRMGGHETWGFIKKNGRWLIRLKKVSFDMFGEMPAN